MPGHRLILRVLVMLILAGPLLLISACTDSADDVIRMGVATAPQQLDPRLASDAISERVNQLLFQGLVRFDENLNPVGDMASWAQIDALRYRFHLMPDRTRFTDGRLPDANDVASTYRSMLDPSQVSPHAGSLSMIDTIEIIDDQTLDFVLTRPDPLFPSRLGIGIMPAEYIGRPHRVVGSGAFEFVGRTADDIVTLRRRSDGQRVALVPVPDPTMRALKIDRGEIQLLQNDLPYEIFTWLHGHADIDVVSQAGNTFSYLGFNLEDPITGSVLVRRAIAYAIDRAAIIRYLFDGHAQPAESILRPTHWAGSSSLQPAGYDPDKARALLAAAGHTGQSSLRISYKTSTDPFRLRIAAAIKAQLAHVGIDLQIESYEWGTFFADIKAGRFQMYSLSWVGVHSPDIFRYVFHSDSVPPAGANRGRYRSGQVDRLIEAAARAEREDAVTLYRQIQAMTHDDLVYVPLWYEDNVVASRDIAGYHPAADGNYLALAQTTWSRHAEQ